MKKLKVLLLILFIIPCCWLFSACSMENSVYVTNIAKTNTEGSVDTYTIYYSDGSKSTITIENGKDGENVTLNLEELFDSCVEKGIYENTAEDYRQFIQDYFSTEETNTETQLAINRSLQSAVSVYAAFPTSNVKYNFNNTYAISAGSGVIYSMDEESNTSYIITNYHVVYATESATSSGIAEKIAVYQYGVIEDITVEQTHTSSYYASYNFGPNAVICDYVGGSLNYDIAVLKVRTSDLIYHNATAMSVKIASNYSVGETAIAVGNPEAEGISATKGIVSVDSENLEMKGADNLTKVTFRVMRIDTSVNGGNSGGGLFNIKGELIGIVNAKAVASTNGSNLENMAYALPIDNVQKVVENILYYNSQTNQVAQVKRLKLGITTTPENGKSTYNPLTGEIVVTNECLVESVSAGLANDMGVKAGDVILAVKINDVTYNISRYFQLKDYLLNVRVNDKFELVIKNEQGEKTLTTTVQSKDISIVK